MFGSVSRSLSLLFVMGLMELLEDGVTTFSVSRSAGIVSMLRLPRWYFQDAEQNPKKFLDLL